MRSVEPRLRLAVRGHPALLEHLGRDGAVIERLPVPYHLLDVEEQCCLWNVAEEGPIHRFHHEVSRAQPEGAEEVAALANVGQFVGHDFPQERADALTGLRL